MLQYHQWSKVKGQQYTKVTKEVVCSQNIGWEPLAAAAGCHCQGVPFNRQEASVPPTNAGQVLKEYSKSQGVDTNVFEKQTSKF